jgi:hypothetical protein
MVLMKNTKLVIIFIPITSNFKWLLICRRILAFGKVFLI